MNLKTKFPIKAQTLNLDKLGQPRKLKLINSKLDNPQSSKRRSSSVVSNNSSLSDKTVITRQTIRSDIYRVKKDQPPKDFVFDSNESAQLSDFHVKSDTPKVHPNSFRKSTPNLNLKKDANKPELEIIREVS